MLLVSLEHLASHIFKESKECGESTISLVNLRLYSPQFSQPKDFLCDAWLLL